MLKKILLTLCLLLFAVSCDAYYAVRYREHATDCTSLTDGKAYDYCFEIDSNDVYKCQPTAGDCDTATEWERVGNYSVAELAVTEWATSLSQGANKYYFYVPSRLNGMILITAHAQVIIAGSGGPTTIDLHRCLPAASSNACSSTDDDMLSINLTIDTGENSSTYATQPVPNTNYDDVITGNIIRVDLDAVPGTAPKGLIVTLYFLRS